jgi:hypothetical protein
MYDQFPFRSINNLHTVDNEPFDLIVHVTLWDVSKRVFIWSGQRVLADQYKCPSIWSMGRFLDDVHIAFWIIQKLFRGTLIFPDTHAAYSPKSSPFDFSYFKAFFCAIEWYLCSSCPPFWNCLFFNKIYLVCIKAWFWVCQENIKLVQKLTNLEQICAANIALHSCLSKLRIWTGWEWTQIGVFRYCKTAWRITTLWWISLEIAAFNIVNKGLFRLTPFD